MLGLIASIIVFCYHWHREAYGCTYFFLNLFISTETADRISITLLPIYGARTNQDSISVNATCHFCKILRPR